MDINYLKKTAATIPAVNKELASEYEEKSDILIREVMDLMLARKDLSELIGENITMLKDNAHNHAKFITSILYNYNSVVFVETVIWVFRAYRNHGFSLTFWSAFLNTWMTVLKGNLSKSTFDGIYPYYNWMITNIPTFIKITD